MSRRASSVLALLLFAALVLPAHLLACLGCVSQMQGCHHAPVAVHQQSISAQCCCTIDAQLPKQTLPASAEIASTGQIDAQIEFASQVLLEISTQHIVVSHSRVSLQRGSPTQFATAAVAVAVLKQSFLI